MVWYKYKFRDNGYIPYQIFYRDHSAYLLLADVNDTTTPKKVKWIAKMNFQGKFSMKTLDISSLYNIPYTYGHQSIYANLFRDEILFILGNGNTSDVHEVDNPAVYSIDPSLNSNPTKLFDIPLPTGFAKFYNSLCILGIGDHVMLSMGGQASDGSEKGAILWCDRSGNCDEKVNSGNTYYEMLPIFKDGKLRGILVSGHHSDPKYCEYDTTTQNMTCTTPNVPTTFTPVFQYDPINQRIIGHEYGSSTGAKQYIWYYKLDDVVNKTWNYVDITPSGSLQFPSGDTADLSTVNKSSLKIVYDMDKREYIVLLGVARGGITTAVLNVKLGDLYNKTGYQYTVYEGESEGIFTSPRGASLERKGDHWEPTVYKRYEVHKSGEWNNLYYQIDPLPQKPKKRNLLPLIILGGLFIISIITTRNQSY